MNYWVVKSEKSYPSKMQRITFIFAWNNVLNPLKLFQRIHLMAGQALYYCQWIFKQSYIRTFWRELEVFKMFSAMLFLLFKTRRLHLSCRSMCYLFYFQRSQLKFYFSIISLFFCARSRKIVIHLYSSSNHGDKERFCVWFWKNSLMVIEEQVTALIKL